MLTNITLKELDIASELAYKDLDKFYHELLKGDELKKMARLKPIEVYQAVLKRTLIERELDREINNKTN